MCLLCENKENLDLNSTLIIDCPQLRVVPTLPKHVSMLFLTFGGDSNGIHDKEIHEGINKIIFEPQPNLVSLYLTGPLGAGMLDDYCRIIDKLGRGDNLSKEEKEIYTEQKNMVTVSLEGNGNFPKLKELSLFYVSIQVLPEIPSLERLIVNTCFIREIAPQRKISYLDIWNAPKLSGVDWAIENKNVRVTMGTISGKEDGKKRGVWNWKFEPYLREEEERTRKQEAEERNWKQQEEERYKISFHGRRRIR